MPDDGDLGMIARRRFGELDGHVDDVADIGEHPDLGLAGLALDDRLELSVHGKLHVALIVWKRRVRRHVLALAGKSGEALQIARDELEASALVVDRERARIPDGEESDRLFFDCRKLAGVSSGR